MQVTIQLFLLFSCSLIVLSSAFSLSSLSISSSSSSRAQPRFATCNDRSPVPSSGLSEQEADDLDDLLSEVLFRMSFFMETDYLERVENDALRNLFQACRTVCEIRESTIPQAGRGLFALQDIPKHTIISFYAVHSVGFKFPSGLCQSVQVLDQEEQRIDHERSQYNLFSYGNRPLLGVDAQEEFNNAKLYVDMNPTYSLPDGWYGGLINDGAIVKHVGDLDYYSNSRSKQNIELIPFSTAPFHVAVTTRKVKAGEELFASYGYRYWKNGLYLNDNNDNDESEKFIKALNKQENLVIEEIYSTLQAVKTKYAEESWVLGQLFDHEMTSQRPPPIRPPLYPETIKKRKRDKLKEKIKVLVLKRKRLLRV